MSFFIKRPKTSSNNNEIVNVVNNNYGINEIRDINSDNNVGNGNAVENTGIDEDNEEYEDVDDDGDSQDEFLQNNHNNDDFRMLQRMRSNNSRISLRAMDLQVL